MKSTVQMQRGAKAKHNDRDFDLTKAPNIDPEKSKDNIYFTKRMKIEPEGLTFTQHEEFVYEHFFEDFINITNTKRKEQKHKPKTTAQFINNRQTGAQSTSFQLGKCHRELDPDTGFKLVYEGASPEELQACVEDFIEWRSKAFPNILLLDWALHLDEASPHVQMRDVYYYHDPETGKRMIGQDKALEEMNVPVYENPDPKKTGERYNNRKITYTVACQEKFKEICREHGLEIEDEKVDNPGRTPQQYAKDAEAEFYKQVLDMKKDLEDRKAELEDQYNQAMRNLKDQEAELDPLKEELTEVISLYNDLNIRVADLSSQYAVQVDKLNKEQHKTEVELATERALIHIDKTKGTQDMSPKARDMLAEAEKEVSEKVSLKQENAQNEPPAFP